MKKLLASLGLMIATSSANASLFTETHSITTSGEGSIGFTHFEVTDAGYFSFYTLDPTFDSMLVLFRDDGILSPDDFLATDDDSCTDAVCGPADEHLNALIENRFLNIGHYFLATAENLSAFEVLIGSTFNWEISDITVVAEIGSLDTGSANAMLGEPAEAPEPSSLALMCLGLFGLAGWARKKRKA
jgi:hypothetical protein